MKKIFAILFFLIISCKSTSSPKVPVDKMAQILKDMHVAQAYLYEQKLSNQDRIKNSKELYVSILSKYQVTKEDFYQSMNYYSEHVQEFDSIYKMVIELSSNPNEN